MKRKAFKDLGYTWSAMIIGIILICLDFSPATAQNVAPIQSGQYWPAIINIRDYSKGSPGLFVLSYNPYLFGTKYADRNGNIHSEVPLDELVPGLPGIDMNVNAFLTADAIYYGLPFQVLGGAQWMIGVIPLYMWSDVSYSVAGESGRSKLSGFGDLNVVPLQLSWGWSHFDLSLAYGFYAPTGRYETGASDNIGLGYWTQQPQLFGYYYPIKDQSTAFMLGLTAEFNHKLKGEDFRAGNRLTLEWGISQYLSDRLEVGIMGGSNWQISDDVGEDVLWNASVHDKKSTLAFTTGYWVWKDRLQMTLKYSFDYAARQRFKMNVLMLNFSFVTNALTGSKSKNENSK